MEREAGLLYRAVLALTEADPDHRLLQNGVGWNSQDGPFGHRLSELSYDDWTPAMRREAWEMLRKYRGQLSQYSIDYDKIEVPEAVEDRGSGLFSIRQEARRAVHEKNARAARKIALSGSLVSIAFPYDAAIVDAVRTIPGRRFDPGSKSWNAPITAASAVLDLAKRFGFSVNDDAAEALADAALGGPAVGNPRRVTADDEYILIEFPYDADLVNGMRDIAGRIWDAERTAWKLRRDALNTVTVDHLLAFAAENDFDLVCRDVLEAERNKSAERIEASRAEDSDIEIAPVGGGVYHLRPFQRAGVAYALKAKRCIIGDEMGLGKTPQSIAVVETAGALPALVVTKASLKYQWLKTELKKWVPDRRAVVVNGSVPPEAADADYVIVNYDRVRRNLDALLALPFKTIIVDESQAVKTGKAQRTQAVKALAKGKEWRLLLTGTAVLNRPAELIAQLQVLDRLNDFGGYKGFTSRYCDAWYNARADVMDTSGNSNLGELNARMRSLCYVRRDKKDVLKELPSVQHTYVPVDLANRDEYLSAEADVISWIGERAASRAESMAELADLPESERRERVAALQRDAEWKAYRAKVLVRLNALRQLCGTGKVEAAKRWVADFLESDEKIIVFAAHTAVIDALAAEFRAPVIDGGTPLKRRQEIVERFQSDPSLKVVVCNIIAAGEGLTMTAASNVLFVEGEWTPARHDQAVGRVYGRLNDVHGATAWYLTANDSIDQWMQELVAAKRTVTDAVNSGEADEVQETGIVAELTKRMLERRAQRWAGTANTPRLPRLN